MLRQRLEERSCAVRDTIKLQRIADECSEAEPNDGRGCVFVRSGGNYEWRG